MALTREFKDTIAARIQRDPRFREALFTEAKPIKSLHRMLAPRGYPSTENFFGIVNTLPKKARVKRTTSSSSCS